MNILIYPFAKMPSLFSKFRETIVCLWRGVWFLCHIIFYDSKDNPHIKCLSVWSGKHYFQPIHTKVWECFHGKRYIWVGDFSRSTESFMTVVPASSATHGWLHFFPLSITRGTKSVYDNVGHVLQVKCWSLLYVFLELKKYRGFFFLTSSFGLFSTANLV